MQIGVVFPQTEIGADPGAVRDFAQAVEGMGFSHLAAFDHVLGADPSKYPDFAPLYTHESMFHEPLAVFAYLAGLTSRIGLVSSILVLPQRQTALVAKQAAEVDVLSGGRLRLGVGNGWNHVEYEALGENFRNRGRRIEEQIAVLRALWTEPLVTFDGAFHTIRDAGINPLPVQQPIPIWLGGMANQVIERVGRLADGWFPRFPSLGQRGQPTIMPHHADPPAAIVERMREAARAAGRDPGAVGIEGRVRLPGRTPEDWRGEYDAWQTLGATHIQAYTMGAGLEGPDDHLAVLRDFADETAGW